MPMQFIAPTAALPADALALDNSADVLAHADTIHRRANVLLHFPKWTDFTVPATGAVISVSIFMASRMMRVSPSLTSAPGWTLTCSTVPAIGARSAFSPPPPPAASPADAAGPERGIVAVPVEEKTKPPNAGFGSASTSTSTSYSTPSTVTLSRMGVPCQSRVSGTGCG